MKILRIAALLAGALALTPSAFADSIDPATFDATLAVGESVTIEKTVTITEAPSTALLDVMFLMDTTGSMGFTITAAKAEASAILAGLGGFGDLASGTALFSGTTSGGGAFPAITSDLSTNDAVTQAGINGYTAGVPSSGGDFPEEGLAGVIDTATNTSWRPDSNRFIVMFGDASESSLELTAGAVAALADNNITLLGVDVTCLGCSFTNAYDALAEGSGGDVYGTGAGLTATILAAVTEAFSTYSTVSLDLSGAPAGVTVGALPGAYNGSFTREIPRTFTFDVTFTGAAVGDYSFTIGALVDGGLVATEEDRIIVADSATPVPEPGTLGLLGLGLLTLALRRRRTV